jgi:PAS domain S-box-containing protein
MSDMSVQMIARDSQFRLLIEAITDHAIYSLDTDGVVITWNAGAERAKGYTAPEILGRHFSLFFTPEDQAAGKPAQALAAARSSGRFGDEGWRVRKDGTRFWASVVIDPILDGNGQLVGFAKITRDMTATQAAQEAIRQSEQHFRLLMDSVVDHAIFTLDPEGLVTSWNSGAERTKGYTREEMLGQHFSRFFTFEDQVAGKPAQVLAIARENRRFEEEAWRVRRDGTRFWASVVIEPMWDNDSQLLGFANVTRDITDRLVLERAKERLYQTQKMELVGQFSGGVAHDFNNLLSIVMGSAELISGLTADERVQRLSQTAHRAAERGAKLTNQLLSYSQRQVLQPQVSNVNDLTEGFEALLMHACGRSIGLRLELEPDPWLTDIDPNQFQSALLSLAVNAQEAMTQGGTLTIRTQNIFVDPAAAVELTEIPPGPYVAITVRDTGAGMNPEVRARAVEPFFSTKPIGRGSGLGLSQVYGFVRQSNGQIKISSEEGHGTSVSIYLPKSTMVKAQDTAKALHASDHGRKIVLVVEDDPDVLEMASEAVRNLGYEVLAAAGAAAALEILQRDQWVDFLFTDVLMPPGMTGVELARDACRIRPALRVLLASGYPREALRDRLKYGMAFIAKPYTMSALGASLAGLIVGTLN